MFGGGPLAPQADLASQREVPTATSHDEQPHRPLPTDFPFLPPSDEESQQRPLIQITWGGDPEAPLINAQGAEDPPDTVRWHYLLVSHWLMLILLSAMMTTLLFTFTPILMDPATSSRDKSVEIWCIVWATRIISQNANAIIMIYFRKYRHFIPFGCYIFQRSLHVFGVFWFIYGTKLLWYDPLPKNSATITWALTFWWFQASVFIFPCIFYSLLCLCLPCLIFILVRAQVPLRDQRPTPQNILDRLEVKTYAELLENLRRQYGLSTPPPPSRPSPGPTTVLNSFLPADILPTAITRATGPAASPDTDGVAGSLGLNTSCPICMLDLERGDEVMVMPCDSRHYFHKNCVEQWLRSSQLCPICRANIVSLISNDEP